MTPRYVVHSASKLRTYIQPTRELKALQQFKRREEAGVDLYHYKWERKKGEIGTVFGCK
ncbi:hypothetical protein FH972_001341 [Carpinus fangiana]|uniref:Uncharacterized protein n=1 Tax=Carpinus fangiana TaxID=176857 RepID=A0A5N6QE31_9ROSI|nr:hypothetical protein FH972_001341 [Carpinus fangiana]